MHMVKRSLSKRCAPKVPNPHSTSRTVLTWNGMASNNIKRNVITFSVNLKTTPSVVLRNISNCVLHKSVVHQSGGPMAPPTFFCSTIQESLIYAFQQIKHVRFQKVKLRGNRPALSSQLTQHAKFLK
jgi:hypothetical protein